jgi:integrase
VLGSLRSFYRWARRAGLITFDPAEDSPSIRVELTLPRPASDAAVDAGMNARDPRVRLMTRLGNEAGLRCCEIVRVHSRDVMGRVGEYSLLVHGKGGKQRVVPIGDELARILLDADGWLFPGQIDGHLSAGYASKLISRAMAGAGTAHPLRHRAATAWLDSSDGNLRVVQELLGHASVATTQIYTQIQDRQKRAAVLNRAA